MRIWYDALTGKHIRYGVAIAKRLRKINHDVILTTRRHPDTLALSKMLDEQFVAVGRYSSKSLLSKLRESIKRQRLLHRMFKDCLPDLAISHRSVELCRIAFGFGIPSISTHDTPHAEAVNRLTLPLIDVLVVSEAIPQHCYQGYGVKRVVRFNGVDEVAWIKNSKPKLYTEYSKPLILVRELESGAVYTKEKIDLTEKVARKLSLLGNVIFLPRYDKRSRKRLIVPEDFVDSANLAANADLVVSVGGTIAREAALQGTPSIVIPTLGILYVNDFLSKRGFPLFTVDISKVFNYAKKYIEKKWDVRDKLAELDDPVDVIAKIVDEYGH